ncbi:MAG: hypothetical protein QGG73_05270 [Candidatus Hydrogenedentes bacterium]|jgi:hypothetical protein|nr:hypothetical protein [Candidatus Hydrogenedentota bacterium]
MRSSSTHGQAAKRTLATMALGAAAGILALTGGCASRAGDAARFVPSAWPTSHADRVISSGFGSRRNPIESDRRQHKGLDIAVLRRSKVRATANGVVAFSGTNPTYGRYGRAVVYLPDRSRANRIYRSAANRDESQRSRTQGPRRDQHFEPA